MITRRRMLLGATGSIPVAWAGAANAASLGVVFQSLLAATVGARQAQGAVLFPQQQAALSSDVDKFGNLKVDGLINMGGNEVVGFTTPGSVFGNLLFALRYDTFPNTEERVFTAHSDDGLEHLTVDLLPANHTVTIFSSTTGAPQHIAFNTQSLRLTAANIIGGVLYKNTFISVINRFWRGSWQFYNLFRNSRAGGSQTENWVVKQYIQGWPDPQNETLPISLGPNPDGSPTYYRQLYIPWGITGSFSYPVLNFTIGASPTLNNPGMQNAVLDSVVFDPNFAGDPAYTQGQLVNANRTFNRPVFGAPSLLYSGSPFVPIHLTGGFVQGVDVGFPWNGGPRAVNVDGDTLIIDPSFNQSSGFSSIESADPAIGDPFQ